MGDWLPFNEIEQTTIYRYRRGDISPRPEILSAECVAFQAARQVYEVGPLMVPLWDALWGSITPADFRLADKLMPAGDWPQGGLSHFFYEDVVLARIVDFQSRYLWGRESTSAPEFECFVAAIRVVRAWDILGQGKATALRILLEGLMSMPTTRDILSRHGLIEPLKDWVSAHFGEASASPDGPIYWAPWMEDENELSRLRKHRMRVASSVRKALFRDDVEDFDELPVINADEGSTWH